MADEGVDRTVGSIARRAGSRAPWLVGAAGYVAYRVQRRSRRTASNGPRAGRHDDLDSRLDALERSLKAVSDNVVATRKQLDHLPYLTVELNRRHTQLINGDQPMPTLGANWSATVPTVLFIIDEILGDARRRTILECGSGASTLWAAAALRHRGDGHVTTLEHDAAFGEQTRARLRAHGLQSWATVVDAPLVDLDVPGLGRQPWYDLAGLGDLSDVDLLFVDGPPGRTARLARYPAVPQLLPRLRPGALVVLDDTNRAAERTTASKWSAAKAFDPPLHVVTRVGRSTVLQVGRSR